MVASDASSFSSDYSPSSSNSSFYSVPGSPTAHEPYASHSPLKPALKHVCSSTRYDSEKTVSFDHKTRVHWSYWSTTEMKQFYVHHRLHLKKVRKRSGLDSQARMRRARFIERRKKLIEHYAQHPEGEEVDVANLVPIDSSLQSLLDDLCPKWATDLVSLRNSASALLTFAPNMFSIIHPFDQHTVNYLNSIGPVTGGNRPEVMIHRKKVNSGKPSGPVKPLFVADYYIPPLLERALLLHRVRHFFRWYTSLGKQTSTKFFDIVGNLIDMEAWKLTLSSDDFDDYFPSLDEDSFWGFEDEEYNYFSAYKQYVEDLEDQYDVKDTPSRVVRPEISDKFHFCNLPFHTPPQQDDEIFIYDDDYFPMV